jgi:proteasome lid subunit RPN8/RPN11
MLVLPPSLRLEMNAHLAKVYPDEGCGALIGTLDGDVKRVRRVVGLTNVEANTKRRRFAIDPMELHKLERAARSAGEAVVGFFHSHPDSPARPSQTDLAWAWPVYSYVIVSVASGIPGETNSFELVGEGDNAKFAQESIIESEEDN